MNRKSNAAGLRKSVKPRESHVPGSAGIPPSARRGLGNRTILETTRNSAGSRLSLYGQTKQKDGRCINEDFIQLTFRRLRDFLTQRHLLSEMPQSTKLTYRQFESLFLTLLRCIYPNYSPPSGNNWMEHEVPSIMETFGYPQKVMKSTLQTVSSKVGPIMGIIDFLIDLAAGMDCNHQEAIRLLSRDESPTLIDLQVELLAQSTFAKGVTVDSPHIQELVRDFCARSKGIVDEDEIRLEHEHVLALKEESEATLQALEDQQAEMEAVQEECAEHVQFIEQMSVRKQNKEQELQAVREQIVTTRAKCAEIEEQIIQTRKIVDAQPISQEDIRRIRAESKDLKEHINLLQQKIHEANSQIEALQGSNRIQQANIQSVCADIASSLVGANIPKSKEQVAEILNCAQQNEQFLAMLIVEQESWTKKIAEFQNKVELQMFELNQKKNQLKTAVEFATQDKEALDEKISYFGARLVKKEAELLGKRQALKNSDNLITFADREVEDLKIQLTTLQEQLELAENKFNEQRFLHSKGAAFAKFYGERIDKVIQMDRCRMEKLVQVYRDQRESLATKQVSEAILQAFSRLKTNE